MKKLLVLITLLLIQNLPSLACTVCKSQQPKALQGITHGTGPGGTLDYIIIGGAAVIVLVTLVLSIRFLVRPGETDPNHIKNLIISNEG